MTKGLVLILVFPPLLSLTNGQTVFLCNGNPDYLADDVEIDDLSGRINCTKPSIYHVRTYGTFGAFVGDRMPIICGGGNKEDRCYGYYANNDTWRGQTLMKTGRWMGRALSLSVSEMWITGGYRSDDIEGNGDGSQRSTEILTMEQDGTISTVPLPIPSYAHQLLRINATHAFFVPGIPHVNQSWFVDLRHLRNESWTLAPGPKFVRAGAFAGLVDDELVLAGGSNGFLLNSTEIFNFQTRTWRSGPDMPIKVAYGAAIEHDHNLVVLGGNVENLGPSDSILTFNHAQGWQMSNKTLQKPRTYFTGLQVPDDFPNCVENSI